MSNFKTIFLMAGFLALAGCSSPTVPDPDMTDTTAGDVGADTGGYDDGGYDDGAAVEDDSSAGELANIIFFDFDSSEVRAADTDTVAGHATMLSGKMNVNVRLEGHADERGSREYNIGLGERRAQAIRQMLMIQGVGAAQIQTVSFGEERPDSMGSSESDYAMNRRVEIKYTN